MALVRSRVTLVQALQSGRRGGGGRGCGFGANSEAMAQEQLLVFAVEVENLQNFPAGLLDNLLARRIGTRGRGAVIAGLERSQAGVEPGEQCAFAIEEHRIGHALLLFEKTIFFQG